MTHNVKIRLGEKSKDDPVISCRTVSVREKLLNRLLGTRTSLTVIVPGNSVEEMEIREIGKEEPHEAV